MQPNKDMIRQTMKPTSLGCTSKQGNSQISHGFPTQMHIDASKGGNISSRDPLTNIDTRFIQINYLTNIEDEPL